MVSNKMTATSLGSTYIGFMPQETALFDEFTIAETFQFYASLYRISSEEFRAKMKELQEVLDLPPDHRTCSTLSGGQVRRVSIAVTLLHTPSLVILDEPTSGLDPMLAHYFWQYLQRMSSNGQTIIITTHYIEEARQANVVGLMRKGVLLAEKSPEELIASYGVDSLEEVFLRLCHQQNQAIEAEPEKKIPFKNPYKDDVNTYTMFWPLCAKSSPPSVRVIEILAGYTIVLVLYNLINIAAMSLVQFVIYGQPYGNFWLSYVLINFIGFTGIFFGE
ncbi:ABC transporter G family member 20-like [Diaphorina citri]|uniref:ABC transporter G family member 20-like n=1 Tax=Diaphorina citri TaxID=121845 RepID=A0A1S4ENT5_DIACI|nr:ABC transporter G family member 20-like [Diaphorina citri]